MSAELTLSCLEQAEPLAIDPDVYVDRDHAAAGASRFSGSVCSRMSRRSRALAARQMKVLDPLFAHGTSNDEATGTGADTVDAMMHSSHRVPSCGQ